MPSIRSASTSALEHRLRRVDARDAASAIGRDLVELQGLVLDGALTVSGFVLVASSARMTAVPRQGSGGLAQVLDRGDVGADGGLRQGRVDPAGVVAERDAGAPDGVEVGEDGAGRPGEAPVLVPGDGGAAVLEEAAFGVQVRRGW